MQRNCFEMLSVRVWSCKEGRVRKRYDLLCDGPHDHAMVLIKELMVHEDDMNRFDGAVFSPACSDANLTSHFMSYTFCIFALAVGLQYRSATSE